MAKVVMFDFRSCGSARACRAAGLSGKVEHVTVMEVRRSGSG